MPISLRVLSWNIQKKQTNAAYIAGIMRSRQIDICALLEVPTSLTGTIPPQIITELNNLNPAYHNGAWLHASVTVGDESVSYIWHDNGAVGVNAFRAEAFPVTGAFVKGKVMRNAANNAIYFPTTQSSWAGLPGTPSGRRPAFMSFVTNDGAAARRFTVLALHCPFNPATSIQSYSTSLYASSREIGSVELIDVYGSAAGASAAATNALGAIDLLLLGSYLPPQRQAIRAGGVQAALDAIQTTINTSGTNLRALLDAAYDAGVDGALDAVGAIPSTTTSADAAELAEACATIGAVAAVRMVASVQLPTAPPLGAPADVAAAATSARAGVSAAVALPMSWGKPKSANERKAKVRAEAKRLARAGLAAFTFAALPLHPVDMAVIAGDFNVDFPDNTAYNGTQLGLLGGNAYSALIARAGAARIANTTTRIGPTAFEGQRIYTLKTPGVVQNANNALPTYVPLNLAPLLAGTTSFMGNNNWIAGLQTLATVAWAQVVQNYGPQITNAFDTEVIDDTTFYRASGYDNVFVRGGAFVQAEMVDVMSELGSWPARPAAVVNPQPPTAAPNPNPWNAAAGGLNTKARTQLGLPGAPLNFTYSGIHFTITPAIDNAEDAAVFFDQYISDHLPIRVAVQV
jgi:endonuclease/exonuclease/phosphatase family metal-dependent hydrolase